MKPIMLTLLCITSALWAQQGLPVHQLHLVEVTQAGDRLSLGDPVQITREQTYQNQPEFLANGDILFTAFQQASNQTDIMRYRAADGVIVKQLESGLSEYSPTLMPDGKHFSVVRVEQDNSQKLYQISLETGVETNVIPRASRVGYHTWLPQNRVALFVVAANPRLVIYDQNEEEFEELFERVGRCIKPVPGTEFFSAVHKGRPNEWYVRAVKGMGKEIEDWFPTLEGSEDYIWLDSNRMLMAKAGAIYLYHRSTSKEWQLVRDFADQGLANITRMAISQDHRQLVVVEGEN